MPLLWFSLVFLAGIALAAGFRQPVALWLGLSASWLIISIFFRYFYPRFPGARFPSNLFNRLFSRSGVSLPLLPYALLPVSLFLGAARLQFAQPDFTNPNFIAAHNDTDALVAVEGVVIRPPDVRDQYIELKIKTLRLKEKDGKGFNPVKGLLLARDFDQGNWGYGDRLIVVGRLETPPEYEEFSYKDYLARRGVYSLMRSTQVALISHDEGNWVLSLIFTYKRIALQSVYRLWPDPEASLLAGILLGDENGIPKELYNAFRDSGTAHIIVISGFNITLLAGMLVGLFSRVLGRGKFGMRRGAGVALIGMTAYTLLVGAEAAVVRAAIMGSLGLFAALVGRRQTGVNTLAIVAAGMAIVNPFVLWDAGFLLSFGATLGLVLYAGPLQAAFVCFASRHMPGELAQRLSSPVGEYFLYTLAAQALTLPLSLYYFGRLSLISLIANPLVLPAQPPILILGGLALLTGTIYLPAGKVLAWLAWPFAAYSIRIVEFLADLPGSALNLGEMSLVSLIGVYACLFLLTVWARQVKSAAQKLPPGLVLGGLALASVLIWRLALAAPDGRLHLTILDVGMGDGLLVQTPGGRSLLIDGGPSTLYLSQQLGRRLPLGRRRLDWLVVAATGEEQIEGLMRNLDRFPPGQVLWAGSPQGTHAARSLQSALVDAGLYPVSAAPGQALDLGDGAMLRVLATSRRGAVLLLEWKNFRALLPIGMDFETLESIQQDPRLRSVTALLLAENGLASINPVDWIVKLRPQVVLLSVGAGNREGLPSPETLDALEGYPLLRTDVNGWIELTTDGEQMWVEVEKK